VTRNSPAAWLFTTGSANAMRLPGAGRQHHRFGGRGRAERPPEQRGARTSTGLRATKVSFFFGRIPGTRVLGFPQRNNTVGAVREVLPRPHGKLPPAGFRPGYIPSPRELGQAHGGGGRSALGKRDVVRARPSWFTIPAAPEVRQAGNPLATLRFASVFPKCGVRSCAVFLGKALPGQAERIILGIWHKVGRGLPLGAGLLQNQKVELSCSHFNPGHHSIARRPRNRTEPAKTSSVLRRNDRNRPGCGLSLCRPFDFHGGRDSIPGIRPCEPRFGIGWPQHCDRPGAQRLRKKTAPQPDMMRQPNPPKANQKEREPLRHTV